MTRTTTISAPGHPRHPTALRRRVQTSIPTRDFLDYSTAILVKYVIHFVGLRVPQILIPTPHRRQRRSRSSLLRTSPSSSSSSSKKRARLWQRCRRRWQAACKCPLHQARHAVLHPALTSSRRHCCPTSENSPSPPTSTSTKRPRRLPFPRLHYPTPLPSSR